MYNILVVEDEQQISRVLLKYLDKEGYHYDLAINGIDAINLFNKNKYHLVLLDIMMEGVDGIEVLQYIRQQSTIPILMTTAKIMEDDRLKGFEFGADDYISKPYSPRELMKRIKVFLKRAYPNTISDLQINDLTINTKTKQVFKQGKEIIFSAQEFRIIEYLAKNKNITVTREQIIEHALVDYEGYDRSIDTYIKRIRKKIEVNPSKPTQLLTKYGLGYVLKDQHEI